MAFVDGQILKASQLNDLANTSDLNDAVEAKINEINGYDLSAAQSAEIAQSASQTSQTAMTMAQSAASSAEAIADNSATFASTSAGLAGTASGAYFRVPQGTSSSTSFIYYLNNAGVATPVAESVGKAGVDAVSATANASAEFLVDSQTGIFTGSGDLVPFRVDQNNRLLIGYDSTKDSIIGVGIIDATKSQEISETTIDNREATLNTGSFIG
jgi:hypothetical protein